MILKHVNIEPTNKCQLNCDYCGDDKTREQGFMKISEYRKILDMIPYPTEVRLFISGEPLLHPHLSTFIVMAVMKGHKVLVHTNGISLTPHLSECLRVIGASYPYKLAISISVHGKRVPKQAEDLINSHPGIVLILQKIVPYPQELKIPEEFEQYVGQVRFNIRWPHNWDIVGSIEHSEKQEWSLPCGFIQDSVAIYWNGDVPVCCTDLNGNRIIGNIFEDGWKGIIRRLENVEEQQRDHCAVICEGCERYEEADN